MEKQKLFSNKKRQKILKELEQGPKKFVELKKIMNLQSNILSYNLKILIKENIIEKQNLYYKLTEQTKDLMPYVRRSNDASLIPLPCVATIVMKDKKILIRKKIQEPEKGKSIFIGGKMDFGEDIFKAVKRHVREKVDIDVKNLKIICINNYLSKKENTASHFVVFFVTAEPIGKPKNAIWKDPKKIRGKMFPDNKFIIKNMLSNRKIKMINSIYYEDSDKFEVVNVC
jgi:ADP-ribose pyrophosphatase YjhB (NUDIX family)